jgi:hypothetical protein
MDAITAEALARTTADGLQNTAISNNNGCNNSRTLLEQQQMVSTQLFLIIRMQ